MESKTKKTIRINNLVLKELEEMCEMMGISQSSFIEISIIEKMAKIRSNSFKKNEINKIYEFDKKVV